MLAIDKLRTSPYKPLTNQVERLHSSINAILGKIVKSHQKDWDTRLSFAMTAYRASRHVSTGYTPNMLTVGTEVRTPSDIMYGSLNKPSSETYDNYVQNMRERMTTDYEAALWRAAEHNKGYHDEPKGTRKASGYITSILVNLLDANTNGSESIPAPSLLSTNRQQSLYSSNDAGEPRP